VGGCRQAALRPRPFGATVAVPVSLWGQTLTEGFIDSASIHGAIATLSRRGHDLSAWDRQSLLDMTYLLLFSKIGVVPGPGAYRGASGLFGHVISGLPSLEERRFRTEGALHATKSWLARTPFAFRGAWDRLRAQPEFPAWAAVTRELFWSHHVRMHTSLFNPDFTPHIALLLGVSEAELNRINILSENESTVRQWVKTNLAGEDAKLANDAYVAAALIRGRLHEYLASGSNLHLAAHPFRKPIERSLKSGRVEPVYNSEEYFVKIIIGSAFRETTEERRVKSWVENIARARASIQLGALALPQAAVDSDAERLAADAARNCRISASYSRIRRELEGAAAMMIGGLFTLGVSPWAGPLGPIAAASYRHYRGVSMGDDLAGFLIDTRRRFRRLARSVPGRIVRTFKRTQPPEK